MADPGRPRLPTAVKEAQGTLEKSRQTVEPSWPEGDSRAPEWLRGVGLEEWNRLVPELRAQGLFTIANQRILAGVCLHYARWREAEDHLDAGESVTVSHTGYEMPSPWVAIANKRWDMYATGCGKFGLDPSSAGKVTARPKDTEDAKLAAKREERRANR